MNAPGDSQLRLLHATMLGGVLVFAAVVLFLVPTESREAPGAILRWGWLAPTLLSVFGAGFVRGRLPRAADEARTRATGVAIWAIAEAGALIGIVATLVTGLETPAVGATVVAVFLMIHHRPSTLV